APAAPAVPDGPVVVEPARPTPAGRRGRVLVVEDNAVNQLVAEGILEQLDLEVALVGNGAEALEVLGRDDFDVVLMDCQMPVMDGYEATRELRRREDAGQAPARHTPVIAMTAGATDKD